MNRKSLVAGLAFLFALVIPATASGFFFSLPIPESLFHLNVTEGAGDGADEDVAAHHRNEEELSSKRSFRIFNFSRIDKAIVDQFVRAWRYAKSGTANVEGMVLVFRKPDGSYSASLGRVTNEYKKVTFQWQPNAIAIFHTHPNDENPEPNGNDCQVADKLSVPIFTLTSRGVYMYDPVIKKKAKLLQGIAWLEASSWSQVRIALLAR